MTFEQALKVAINAEIKAYELYVKTSEKVSSAGTKKMLLELAEQESGHRKILENIVAGGDYKKLGQTLPEDNLGISEFLVVPNLQKDATIQEILIFAINEETKAMHFYTQLKNHFAGSEVTELFDKLAAEERGHKIKLEQDYENQFMREN